MILAGERILGRKWALRGRIYCEWRELLRMSWHHSNDSIELMPRQPSSRKYVLAHFRNTIYAANTKRTFKFGCDDAPVVQRHASASMSGQSQVAANTNFYIDECNVALQIIKSLRHWSNFNHYPWHLLSQIRERRLLCKSWVVFSWAWTQDDESLYCLVSGSQKIAPESPIKWENQLSESAGPDLFCISALELHSNFQVWLLSLEGNKFNLKIKNPGINCTAMSHVPIF